MSNGQTLAQMHPSLKTIYDFLWLIGEAIFFYLPVGICWSAVKKMGGTPILGIVLGVTSSPAADERLSPRPAGAGGVELRPVYHCQSRLRAQVIPALLAGTAQALSRRASSALCLTTSTVIVPVCSLILASVPRARHYRSVRPPDRRRRGLRGTPSVNRQLRADRHRVRLPLRALVITGVHQTTLAIDMQMIQSMGGTPVWPLIALSNIAGRRRWSASSSPAASRMNVKSRYRRRLRYLRVTSQRCTVSTASRCCAQ